MPEGECAVGKWTANVVTEPAQDHALCLDLFEDDIHRARLQRNQQGEFTLVGYGDAFELPAIWLANTIQRFVAEAPSPRRGSTSGTILSRGRSHRYTMRSRRRGRGSRGAVRGGTGWQG